MARSSTLETIPGPIALATVAAALYIIYNWGVIVSYAYDMTLRLHLTQ